MSTISYDLIDARLPQVAEARKDGAGCARSCALLLPRLSIAVAPVDRAPADVSCCASRALVRLTHPPACSRHSQPRSQQTPSYLNTCCAFQNVFLVVLLLRTKVQFTDE